MVVVSAPCAPVTALKKTQHKYYKILRAFGSEGNRRTPEETANAILGHSVRSDKVGTLARQIISKVSAIRAYPVKNTPSDKNTPPSGVPIYN